MSAILPCCKKSYFWGTCELDLNFTSKENFQSRLCLSFLPHFNCWLTFQQEMVPFSFGDNLPTTTCYINAWLIAYGDASFEALNSSIHGPLSWSPPISGVIKYNSNSSRDPQTGLYGVGIVFRDDNRMILYGYSDLIHAADA